MVEKIDSAGQKVEGGVVIGDHPFRDPRSFERGKLIGDFLDLLEDCRLLPFVHFREVKSRSDHSVFDCEVYQVPFGPHVRLHSVDLSENSFSLSGVFVSTGFPVPPALFVFR
jgi:hypothetical protein